MKNIVNLLNNLDKKKCISLDCESNGLYGEVFSISAVVFENDIIVDKFVGRTGIEGKIDEFVIINVLPAMNNIKVNYKNYEEMIESLSQFLYKYPGFAMIFHAGFLLEYKIIVDINKTELGKNFSKSNFCFIDTHTFIESIDKYCEENKIAIEGFYEITPHNPTYDAIANYKVFSHFMEGLKNEIKQCDI